MAITTLSQLGGIAAMRGKLKEAENLFQRALHFAADEVGMATPGPAVGVAHGWLMWLDYQRNAIAGAQAHLDHVLAAAGQMGTPATTARAYAYQALLAQRRGELDAAVGWFERAEDLLRAHAIGGLVQAEWTAFRGQLYLRQGDGAGAAALLTAQGFTASDLDGQPTHWLGPRLVGHVLLVRVLAAQRATQRALALLERIAALAEQLPDTAILLAALALRATMLNTARGDPGAALSCLARALNLAAAEDFIAPFLAAGEPLLPLLRQAIAQEIQPGFARKLLETLADEARRWAVAGQTREELRDSAGLAEPPTDRERQV